MDILRILIECNSKTDDVILNFRFNHAGIKNNGQMCSSS